MPTPLEELRRRMLASMTPSPEDVIAKQTEDTRRAFIDRAEDTPVTLAEAVRELIPSPGPRLQRQQEEFLGQDVANPNEGIVSIPEAMRRRGDVGPVQGALSALMGPLALPYLASPSIRRVTDVGSQFMPGGNVIFDDALMQKVLDRIPKLSKKYLGLASEAAQDELAADASGMLFNWYTQAQEAKGTVPFNSVDDFIARGMEPQMQARAREISDREKAFGNISDIVTQKDPDAELAGRYAENQEQDITGTIREKQTGNIGRTLREAAEAKEAGPQVFERMAQAETQDLSKVKAETKGRLKGRAEKDIATRIFARGESPSRAMQDTGVTVFGPITENVKLTRGELQAALQGSLKKTKELPFDAMMTKPAAILNKAGFSEEQIVETVDKVIDSFKQRPLRYRNAAIRYLIEGDSPQTSMRAALSRSGGSWTSADELRAKRTLEAITSRVFEHFGIQRLDAKTINKMIR